MFWSRNGQGDTQQRLAHLELEVAKVSSALRQLEAEQLTVHDQVRKWMRRASAGERNQERAGIAAPVTPAPHPILTGARLRIAMRRQRAALRQAEQPASAEEGTDGVHP